MSALIHNFEFEGNGVRTVLRADEPWFVMSDVCRVLEISNVSHAATRLDADEKDNIVISDVIGRDRETLVINEPGLFSLILTSRKEAAKRFKRWVTHEVLPALRKTGIYRMRAEDDDLPSAADRKVFGLPVAKVNAAANMISLVNRIFGPEAARKLFESEPGLPKLGEFSVGALAGTEMDDPDGCLAHLLRCACGNGQSVASVLRLALQDGAAAVNLPQLGLLADPVGHKGRVAIASSHPFLEAAFAPTQWAGLWRIALMQLPDAKSGTAKIGGKTLPVTLVPKRVILDRL